MEHGQLPISGVSIMKLKLFLLLFLIIPFTVFAQDVETHEIDLLAGPSGTTALLAPNGEIFAYVRPDKGICIYTIEGEEQECFPLPEMMPRLALDSMAWSPDSTKLVMHAEFFI